MIVETTLRKALFLRMGTWLIPADRETKRRVKALRKWIEEQIADALDEAEVNLLDGGGFSLTRRSDDAFMAVEIDWSTDQLNILPLMFGRGVIWPTNLTDEQDDELDELEEDVKEWVEQDTAERAARKLSKKQKKRLAEELAKETGDDES